MGRVGAVKDVPVDGFWSITMYNAEYFFVDNPLNRYTLGTEFQANSSTVAFAAAAPFAAVLIGLALIAAYVIMSRFGEVRQLAED